MEIQIIVKVLGAGDSGKPDEPSLDNVLEFIKSISDLPGVKVTVE